MGSIRKNTRSRRREPLRQIRGLSRSAMQERARQDDALLDAMLDSTFLELRDFKPSLSSSATAAQMRFYQEVCGLADKIGADDGDAATTPKDLIARTLETWTDAVAAMADPGVTEEQMRRIADGAGLEVSEETWEQVRARGPYTLTMEAVPPVRPESGAEE